MDRRRTKSFSRDGLYRVPQLRSQVLRPLAIRRRVQETGGHPQKVGTVQFLRFVPTSRGLAIAVRECAGCHTRNMPDGSQLDRAPENDPGDRIAEELSSAGAGRSFMGESPSIANWRNFAVPWIPNDIHDAIRDMSQEQQDELLASNVVGTETRFNGSPYFATKVPDLIRAGERKYIDATATHRLRTPDDIARYAALVNCCDAADFGPHHMLNSRRHVIQDPFSDYLLYALAQYIVSLEPPKNPNLGDPRAALGKRIFERGGCAGCHTPPLYTNNKLTLAQGYHLPKDHPFATDIIPISVGTDPNLALRTRKGTGLYKIPALKGVWYRGLYGHDGSVASLEDSRSVP
jgi:mono/diheme cytochrome c family protein